jgi:nucleotide-binding universal stress UspA family protein
MIKHILVPLDGTSFAEAALPATRALAKLLASKVTLLHVVEQAPEPVTHGEKHLTEREEAVRYLRHLSQQFSDESIACYCHVHSEAVSHVAGGIVAHEEELHPDLVVMCTHGPANLERLLRGSLAQQVVALGQTPLLLVHPGTRAAEDSFTLKQLLVPLDGDSGHENGFDLACLLAAASHSRFHLLSVLPEPFFLAGRRGTLSRFLPGATWAVQRMSQQFLKTYLEGLLDKAETMGIEGTGEVLYGKIAKTICEVAERIDADLIVLTTHGKAGTEAFWANSVAAKVQGLSSRALLLVPV